MPVEDIILRLRKYRFLLLFVFLFATGLSYYFMHYYHSVYKAEVVFMLNDMELTDVGLTELELTNAARTSNFTTEKFYRFLLSDELIRSVDKKLLLGKHYGLDESEKEYFWKLSNVLTKNLLVVKNGFNFMNLTVMDKDKDYVVQLAEAIVTELKRMNTAYSQSVVNERIRLYNLMQNDMKTDLGAGIELLNTALLDIKQTQTPETKPELTQLRYSILKFKDKLDEVTNKLGNYSKMYLIANQAVDPQNLDKFYVINKKYYQSKITDVWYDASISVLIGILSVIVIILSGYFFHINRNLFNLFFKGHST